MARPGRHGPGADGDERPALHLDETPWEWGKGYGRQTAPGIPRGRHRLRHQAQHSCGCWRQRLQGDGGCRPKPRPTTSSRSSGRIFLSNGPGHPAATGTTRCGDPEPDRARHPTFGICLGTRCWASRSAQDHEDAPGPPRRQPSGQGPHHRKVEITSMNSWLSRSTARACRRTQSRPTVAFDGSNCGIALKTSRCSRCSTTGGIARAEDSRYLFDAVRGDDAGNAGARNACNLRCCWRPGTQALLPYIPYLGVALRGGNGGNVGLAVLLGQRAFDLRQCPPQDVALPDIAGQIAAFVPGTTARVLDYGCGDALHAAPRGGGRGHVLLCDSRASVRAAMAARFAGNRASRCCTGRRWSSAPIAASI